MASVQVDGLRVVKRGTTICSVDELFLDAGERLAVVGLNGSGKSTLLRVLAGLEKDYQGRVVVPAIRQECVYVHQSPVLLRGTVMTNMMYGLRLRRLGWQPARRIAKEWLQTFNVGDLAATSVQRLSGGEVRRVALARAMVLRPRLLLLDEPLADIDEQGASALKSALQQLDQSTVIITSPVPLRHDLVSRTVGLAAPASGDAAS